MRLETLKNIAFWIIICAFVIFTWALVFGYFNR